MGQIYTINPAEKVPSGAAPTVTLDFEVPFSDGVAQAYIDCDPNLYGSWAVWQSPSSGDQICVSQYSDPTWLEAGPQVILFDMVMSSQRTVRLDIPGTVPFKSEVWFDGVKAYWNGKQWQAQVNQPADVIGKTVDVIWSGHGGWHFLVNYASFGSVIAMDTSTINTTMLAPTKARGISYMADGAYLSSDLVQCIGKNYDSDLGCMVLELISLFDSNIPELTVILNGEDSPGKRTNYLNRTFTNVGGVLEVPLGDTWIRPQSQIRVLLVNPKTGAYNGQWLSNQYIWYNPNTTSELGR